LKRRVFRLELKIDRVGEERRESGSWFQIVGAAKEKDLRPSSVLVKGMTS